MEKITSQTMKLNKFLFSILFLYFFYLTSVFAVEIKKSDIKIIGNQSISKETVLNYANSKKEILNTDDLSIFQKKLFETNFFSKVDVKISGNEVIVHLSENPIVEYLVITGLEKNQDLIKRVEKVITLKENNIFSEFLLNNDIKSIYELLSAEGYFKSTVEYKVNQIKNNKVNIFLDIKLNQKFFVKNIFFIGDKKISTSDLKSIISTTEKSWLDLFGNSSVPSVDRINFDISSLKNFYLSKGYYDVQISNGSIDIVEKNMVNITFVINAGDMYVFDKIIINNKSVSLKNEDLLFFNKKTKSIEGNNYSPKSIGNLLKTFNDYFSQNNILLKTDYSLNKLSPAKISVTFNITDINEKRLINNIKVNGNEITEETVIRNAIFFSEGDVFNSFNISRSLDSLKSLNIFKKVNIDTKDEENTKNINVNISVEEKPTGEISAGAGVGTAGAVISFMLKESNLFGKGINSDISLSLGTEKVMGRVALSDRNYNNKGNSLSGSLYISQYNYDNSKYDNKIIGSDISTSYEVFKDITLETGFSADLDSIDVQSGASDLIKSRDGNYTTTKFFYNVYHDKRNRKYQPTSGYTTGFGQGLATLLSDVPYITNSIFGSVYNEFADGFLGTFKYKVKSINSFGDKDIKLSDRIFLSGSEVRGFTPRGTGPTVGNDHVGGNYSYSTSVATTVPNGLPDSWGTKSNIFFDAANVWGTDFSGALDNNKIKSSFGVGAEWVSPLGPLSVTYSVPVSKDSTDSIENFTFRIGGIF